MCGLVFTLFTFIKKYKWLIEDSNSIFFESLEISSFILNLTFLLLSTLASCFAMGQKCFSPFKFPEKLSKCLILLLVCQVTHTNKLWDDQGLKTVFIEKRKTHTKILIFSVTDVALIGTENVWRWELHLKETPNPSYAFSVWCRMVWPSPCQQTGCVWGPLKPLLMFHSVSARSRVISQGLDWTEFLAV